MIYHIGEYYKYYGIKKKFRLINVDRWLYIFECGHRVTDCIFTDLVRCSTGEQVYKEVQLSIFFDGG